MLRNDKEKIIENVFNGIPIPRPPVWFMRQAGRVLPSYMALRKKYGFKQLMNTPELAAEVTLLPIDELDVDAAILFSDILVIPEALGMELSFDPKPHFHTALKKINQKHPHILKPQPDKLYHVYETIDLIVANKPKNISLIGFCGAPFTVLCYMYEGLGTNRSFPNLLSAVYKERTYICKLIDQITEMSIEYAVNQVNHGIDIFQLFDTHAGLLPFGLYRELFFPAIRKILKSVRDKGVPTIFFPKGIGIGIRYITTDMTDGVSIDWQTPLEEVRQWVGKDMVLQGNFDPRLLLTNPITIDKTFQKLLKFGHKEKKWIFNLGHGVLPDTPIENAKYLVKKIKNSNW